MPSDGAYEIRLGKGFSRDSVIILTRAPPARRHLRQYATDTCVACRRKRRTTHGCSHVTKLGKAFLQIAALQKDCHRLLDDWPPVPVQLLEMFWHPDQELLFDSDRRRALEKAAQSLTFHPGKCARGSRAQRGCPLPTSGSSSCPQRPVTLAP